MVRAFHWQYGDILLAIYFCVFTYYFVLSLKNKYTILLYYTILYYLIVVTITSRHSNKFECSQNQKKDRGLAVDVFANQT